ncbi:hypothetical protein TVAG_305350 [Trichomonas vaginalis G3]|uniref:Uncharacterized protein n=1 Tax=Trichomonas vaginalis (strain ATCC PRA-98 / G3) TaxID=412133 RepID=A2ERB0_TRIV3|nr:armadillo (ARM) repeat-containing protein family [Trichomonas vaginalis G3]EAY04786.1 hypothetical protein TVAG_305350 [Trichomonas vaginalis G3]KAI5490987.1 armadillo (ARM) repeat-containing protein family [Trichomonas vaginalis G3]|eukprot:XP_001317009.1 hypothetical protein [Trichomonas vaginalis G3]
MEKGVDIEPSITNLIIDGQARETKTYEEQNYPEIEKISKELLDSNEQQKLVIELLNVVASNKPLISPEQLEAYFSYLQVQNLQPEIAKLILYAIEIHTVNLPDSEPLVFPQYSIQLLLNFISLKSTFLILAKMIERDPETVPALDQISCGSIVSTIQNLLPNFNEIVDSALVFTAAVWSTKYDLSNSASLFPLIMSYQLYYNFPKNSFLALKSFVHRSESNAINFIECNATDCFTNICQYPDSIYNALSFLNELIYQTKKIRKLLDEYNLNLIFNWVINSAKFNSKINYEKSLKLIENIIYNYLNYGTPLKSSYVVHWLISRRIYDSLFKNSENCSSDAKISIIKILAYMLIYSTPSQCNYLINKYPLIPLLAEMVSKSSDENLNALISVALETVVIFLEFQMKGVETRLEKLRGVPDHILDEYLKKVEENIKDSPYKLENSIIDLPDGLREEIIELNELDDNENECLYRFIEDLDQIFNDV